MNETHAACLTPPGKGAIATLAVRGPSAWTMACKLFQCKHGLPEAPEAGRFWLGRIGEGVGDQVVLAVKKVGPDPWLEIHCHGGRALTDWLLGVLEKHGIRRCTWQELEPLTSGQPVRAAAAIALSHARTLRTAAILLDQYQGAFGATIATILAELDKNPESAGKKLHDFACWATLGRHLTQPWRVVVAGPPNVGKSSLVNALAGYQRSVVSAIPGTTRDVVTTTLALDGWPVELADTAGLRADAQALEEQGIGLAQQAMRSADLCLWVLDGSGPLVLPEVPDPSLQLVINKVDLSAAWDPATVPDAVHVSARTGAGLAELCEVVARRLVPEAPAAGAAVPFTADLCAKVEKAWVAFGNGEVELARLILTSLLT